MAWILPVLSILGDTLSKGSEMRDSAARQQDSIEAERLKNEGAIFQHQRSSPNYSAILSVQRPKSDSGLGGAIQALGSLGSLFGSGGGEDTAGLGEGDVDLDTSKSSLLNDDFEGANYDPDKTAAYKSGLGLIDDKSGSAPITIGTPAKLDGLSSPAPRLSDDPDWTDPELTRRLTGRIHL